MTEQERNYNNAQESARKAAERGVRMLQARDKAVRKGVTVEQVNIQLVENMGF